jgi:hypothetical protein
MNTLDAADEAQEVLWQRLLEYDQARGGLLNYHDLRRLLPQWKREDPRLSRIPAESCQALVKVLVQRLEQYRQTGDPEALVRPRLSFHFNRILILGVADTDPMHTIRVYLPKFGTMRCTSEHEELINFLAHQPDSYRIKGARLFWNTEAWHLVISFRRVVPKTKPPLNPMILQGLSMSSSSARHPWRQSPPKIY